MSPYFLTMFYSLLLFMLQTTAFTKSVEAKCIERERLALLNFKHSLADYGMLSTWSDDDNNTDCCNWNGIQCNNQTGHVPFQIGNLKHLQYLDLGDYLLSGAIPFQNGNLPNLHTLRLGGNFDIKAEDAEWLSDLSSLKNLALISLYNLSSSPQWLYSIRKLIPNLRELRLVQCSLSDTHIKSLFYSHPNLSASLTILDLSDNVITSSTFQLLFTISLNLQELHLSDNKIALSSSLYPKFPSLKILDLSLNNLTSSIFRGSFNFSSKLQELYLVNCSLVDTNFLVSSTSEMNSPSSLLTLYLSSNLLKSSTVFDWLFNSTTNLRILYLHSNLLEGPIPDGFGKVMNSLEVLDISHNKLQGKIHTSLGNIFTLQRLYLGNNNLSGEISSFIQNSSWCKRPVLQTLDLSGNRITGVLPNLSILSSLKNLDLSNNQLTGEIPKSIGLLYELQYLNLEENYLKGDIIESHLTNLSKLKGLDLTDNSLSLKFATTWVPPFQLLTLGLGSCKLGPSFPSWLQTQSYLLFLDISDAEIDDYVPEWFGTCYNL